MLLPTFAFGTDIPLGTFMYMSQSSGPYKYEIMTSINCKDRSFALPEIQDIGKLFHSLPENMFH
jgi:hypothetical protein